MSIEYVSPLRKIVFIQRVALFSASNAAQTLKLAYVNQSEWRSAVIDYSAQHLLVDRFVKPILDFDFDPEEHKQQQQRRRQSVLDDEHQCKRRMQVNRVLKHFSEFRKVVSFVFRRVSQENNDIVSKVKELLTLLFDTVLEQGKQRPLHPQLIEFIAPVSANWYFANWAVQNVRNENLLLFLFPDDNNNNNNNDDQNDDDRTPKTHPLWKLFFYDKANKFTLEDSYKIDFDEIRRRVIATGQWVTHSEVIFNKIRGKLGSLVRNAATAGNVGALKILLDPSRDRRFVRMLENLYLYFDFNQRVDSSATANNNEVSYNDPGQFSVPLQGNATFYSPQFQSPKHFARNYIHELYKDAILFAQGGNTTNTATSPDSESPTKSGATRNLARAQILLPHNNPPAVHNFLSSKKSKSRQYALELSESRQNQHDKNICEVVKFALEEYVRNFDFVVNSVGEMKMQEKERRELLDRVLPQEISEKMLKYIDQIGNRHYSEVCSRLNKSSDAMIAPPSFTANEVFKILTTLDTSRKTLFQTTFTRAVRKNQLELVKYFVEDLKMFQHPGQDICGNHPKCFESRSRASTPFLMSIEHGSFEVFNYFIQDYWFKNTTGARKPLFTNRYAEVSSHSRRYDNPLLFCTEVGKVRPGTAMRPSSLRHRVASIPVAKKDLVFRCQSNVQFAKISFEMAKIMLDAASGQREVYGGADANEDSRIFSVTFDELINGTTVSAFHMTPLHAACMRGRIDLVKLFLAFSANPAIRDIKGFPASELFQVAFIREMMLYISFRSPESTFSVDANVRLDAMIDNIATKVRVRNDLMEAAKDVDEFYRVEFTENEETMIYSLATSFRKLIKKIYGSNTMKRIKNKKNYN